MADTQSFSTRCLTLTKQDTAGPNTATPNALDDLIDRFWAKLLNQVRQEKAQLIPPTGEHDGRKRKRGKPPTITHTFPATTINKRCPPGLRANRVFTRKYRPHTWRATRYKQRPKQEMSSAHRTMPNGKILDLTGHQVHGTSLQQPTSTYTLRDFVSNYIEDGARSDGISQHPV
ncbi:Hypothetical predicted protein [Pelobates cultripes]|uniref:Uncharacterized protein n=1 Tax=Pelobates cultripes TaxID=61616 RepID=A0AAD1W7H6_PELCU|nr:Hypothetical predicted protein [Pelobates cultripes]